MSNSKKPGLTRKVITASIDPGLHARLSDLSESTSLSMSWLIGQAVKNYVAAAEAQAGGDE